MSFFLPFAPHLGFPLIDMPLFRQRVGSSDAVRQIAFAAEYGFAGVQDPFAATRTEEEQVRIGAAIKNYGLRVGCYTYASPDVMMASPWGSGDRAIEERIEADVAAALEIGKRTGAREIAVLSAATSVHSPGRQRDNMARLLRRLGSRASDEGFTLCLEAVDASRLPWALLHHLADAADVVRAVDNPSVRLIFDTGHVAAMDGDPNAALDSVWDVVEIVQIADFPGHVEIGGGGVPLENFILSVMRRGYGGLLELEHRWSAEGPAVETDYLRRLASLDKRARLSVI
jgi:hydroxypyruvate isomerase